MKRDLFVKFIAETHQHKIFELLNNILLSLTIWQLLKIMKIWFLSVIFLWILDWPCLKKPLDCHISTMSRHSKDLQSCSTFIRTFEYFFRYWNICWQVCSVLETWLNWEENKTPMGLDTKITEFYCNWLVFFRVKGTKFSYLT